MRRLKCVASKVIFWDFDGTLGYCPEGWAGTLAAVLAAHDPGSAVTAQGLRRFLNEGFPWPTPEIPHPELATPGLWWERLEAVLSRVYVAVGLPREIADALSHQKWLSGPK
ncbi:MAG: hypothetical protein HYY04_14010 [Chloroflexi bacterium]|nr:hypothetical protein [Chloroflexota bacterium]